MAARRFSARSRRRCVFLVLVPFLLVLLSVLGQVVHPGWFQPLSEPVFVPSESTLLLTQARIFACDWLRALGLSEAPDCL